MKTRCPGCRSVRKNLLLDRPRAAAETADHLMVCPNCRPFAETIQTLNTLGAGLRRTEVSPHTASETRRRVAEILSNHVRARPFPTVWSEIRVTATAFVAVVLVAVVVGLWQHNTEKKPDLQSPMATTDQTTGLAAATEWETTEFLAETIRSGLRALRNSFAAGTTENLATRFSSLSVRMGELRHNLEEDLRGLVPMAGQM